MHNPIYCLEKLYSAGRTQEDPRDSLCGGGGLRTWKDSGRRYRKYWKRDSFGEKELLRSVQGPMEVLQDPGSSLSNVPRFCLKTKSKRGLGSSSVVEQLPWSSICKKIKGLKGPSKDLLCL